MPSLVSSLLHFIRSKADVKVKKIAASLIDGKKEGREGGEKEEDAIVREARVIVIEEEVLRLQSLIDSVG